MFNSKTKVWSGPDLQYPFSLDTFMGEEILKSLDKTPERIIRINADDGSQITCNEMKLNSIRIAKALIKMNIKSDDDIVGFVVHQSTHFLPVLYGSIIAGAPFNTVIFEKDEIVPIFEKTRPKIVFCDVPTYQLTKECLAEIGIDSPIYTMDSKIPSVPFVEDLLLPTNDEESFIPEKFATNSSKKILGYICSSGTTGAMKLCSIPHLYSLATVHIIIEKGLSRPYKSLSFSRCSWTTGIIGCLMAAFNANETVVFTKNNFSVELFVKLVKKYKINSSLLGQSTIFMVVNSPLSKSKDLSSLKTIIFTGSILSECVRQKFKENFPEKSLTIIYGLTEVLVARFPTCEDFQDYQGLKVGKIVPGSHVKIIDENKKALNNGQIGEVCVKSDYQFLGYFKDEMATQKAMMIDGFTRTGDLGYFDEDGTLFIVERIKSIFKSFGDQVTTLMICY